MCRNQAFLIFAAISKQNKENPEHICVDTGK